MLALTPPSGEGAVDVAVMPGLEEGAREAGVRLGNPVFQQPERGEERIWA